MEEKLTFTRVPRSVYWLCNTNFQQSKKTYTAIVDYFQSEPALKHLLHRALPTGEGKPSLEAQLSGYGVKGFRDRLGEMYLFHLETGFFPDEVEADLIIDVQEFEQRYERFSTLSDHRVFMLGLYLKMKDIEAANMYGSETAHISPPLEVDEALAACEAKVPRLDWMIVALSSLLKFWSGDQLKSYLKEGADRLLKRIQNLDDKSKLIFFNDMCSYGHAIDESDFFLYLRV